MGPHTENYVWGKFPVPPDAPWFEPLTMLTAIAAVTDGVRLATGILIVPLRPAALLAEAGRNARPDVRGRVDLGVGTGWQREEYDARASTSSKRGPAAHRRARRDARRCGATRPPTFTSPTLSFHDIYCEPKPLQPGGVPFWIAGTLHARNLDALVRWGDAWIPIMGETIDGIADGAAQIRDAWRAAGRDPSAPAGAGAVAHGDAATTAGPISPAASQSVPELVAAGATDIT